ARSGAAAELSASRTALPLRDPDLPDDRALLEVLPAEAARVFELELEAERLRVVVVDEHERLARGERLEGLEDRRVLLARRDDPHIELGRLLRRLGHGSLLSIAFFAARGPSFRAIGVQSRDGTKGAQ